LDISNDLLSTDTLQFGFKDNICYIHTDVYKIISYFADTGSPVFVASLDISKAFDSVNHFKLYSSLLRVGIPVMVIDVLCGW